MPVVPGLLPGGWFVPLLLGLAGAGTGAAAGLLMSRSIAERGAFYYDDEVRAGRTLVTVHGNSAQAALARRIVLEHGAFDASPAETPMRKRGLAG
jgi:hypothetical protein